MLLRLWKQFISWVMTIFGKTPVTVGEALTTAIEENDIEKFARKHFEFSEGRFAELQKVQQALRSKAKTLVQVTSSAAMVDHIAFLATWLAQTNGISIGIASPNLPMSYNIRREIDDATEHMKKKINNKDTIIFENDARIDVVNHNRLRGHRYDVLLLNAAEHVAEPYLGQYTIAFNMVTGQGGYVLSYCEDFADVKTTYFPGFSRLNLTDTL
jgi:hypothetical protein